MSVDAEVSEPLTVEDAKSVIDYVRTAIDFDQRTAAWALDEVEGILNNWGHLHGMDLYLEADELVEPACDHVTGGVPDEEGKAMVFRYCPKCGERLDPTEQDLYRVANWSGTKED